MGSVTADFVDGHEDAQDDPEGAEDEKGDGKADLLVGRAVVNGVGIVHHDILIGNGEGVVMALEKEITEAKEGERISPAEDGLVVKKSPTTMVAQYQDQPNKEKPEATTVTGVC
ncbi:hypothetical protein V6N11_026643 [Hibiscus sabdariffa]|uniref:Uncharacterized protein n=1 Tax=Hibiscus sabdariffa TaxID=183260 RepID=A0ABR2SWA3_9ROSI